MPALPQTLLPHWILSCLQGAFLFASLLLLIDGARSAFLYLRACLRIFNEHGGSWTPSSGQKELLARIGRRLIATGWKLLALILGWIVWMTLLLGITSYTRSF